MTATAHEANPVRKRILAVLIVLVAVVAAFVLFLNMNESRIEKQNTRYLQSSTEQSARRIDEWMSDSQIELALLASRYASSLDPGFTHDEISSMMRVDDPTKFDRVTFLDHGGHAFDKNGSADTSVDQWCYMQGMQGESGVCKEDPEASAGMTIAFYTPFKIDDQVLGVIVGEYDSDSIEEILGTYFIGVRTSTYLCYSDGSLLAWSSEYELGSITNIQELFFAEGSQDGISLEEFDQAFQEGGNVSFKFELNNRSGIASAMGLPDYDFVVLRTFPRSVTAEMQAEANFAGVLLVTIVAAALLALSALLLVQFLRKNRKLKDENDYANEVIQSSLNLFQRFAVVDLDRGKFSYLKEDENKMQVHNERSYADFRKAWKANLANPNDEVNKELDPERIREKLPADVPFEQIEYRTLDRTTGREHWIQCSIISLTRHPDGEVATVLIAVSDVTEMKQRELQNHIALEKALRQAEEASRAKSDFLNSMSHDIRTPMNSIVGLTAIASMHVDDPDRVKDCLTKITSSSHHLLSLINEVLDMAKIESGKLELSHEDFNLSESVENLISVMKPQTDGKGLTLKVDIEGIVHEHLVGDPMRLQQIFVNIMGNSVKFTPKGGEIDLHIKELPSQIEGMGRYEFKFADTGCGMSEEFMKTVFEPFTRANDSRVTKVEGTGLGMSIVRSIVNLMDGTIDVESTLGEGTTFTVTVYIKLRDVEDFDVEELAGMSVLVVDDEEDARESACEILHSIGMKATAVDSGDEAVKMVKEAAEAGNGFAAVILDWKMPGKSGVETARDIRAGVAHDLPIIILSAYDWSSVEQEARTVGVDAFIAKPLFRSRLTRVLKDVLIGEDEHEAEGLEAFAKNNFSGKRVLLTEDNFIAASIAEEILDMVGIEVDHAENGRESVEMLLDAEPDHYDLVFMDIQMPIMNGYEAARAIRAAAKGEGLDDTTIEPREDLATLPIIALTADAFAEDIAKAVAAGMNAHMSKPMEIDVLINVLKEWL